MTTQPLDISIDLSDVAVVPPVGQTERPRIFIQPIEHEPDNYLLILDNTAAEKVMRCPTAGRYYMIDSREGHAKNAALTFGGAIHSALEIYYHGGTVEEQNLAIVKYFTDNPSPPDEYRTPQMAIQVMNHYRVQSDIRVDYQWTILEDDDGPIIERPFELPLGVLEVNEKLRLPKWDAPRYIRDMHVAWAGRIDVAVNCNNMNRVCDHKTTSMGGDQFIQGFQLSNQTVGYDWAAKQMWPDLFPNGSPAGFVLNAIHLKKPTGSGSLMDKGPRGGEPALNFFRAYFEYSQQRIDQWAVNQLAIVEDFVHDLVRDYFPLYTAHCFNKFGKCPYFDVCTIDDPAIRLRMLNSDAYKDVTWDPTIGR